MFCRLSSFGTRLLRDIPQAHDTLCKKMPLVKLEEKLGGVGSLKGTTTKVPWHWKIRKHALTNHLEGQQLRKILHLNVEPHQESQNEDMHEQTPRYETNHETKHKVQTISVMKPTKTSTGQIILMTTMLGALWVRFTKNYTWHRSRRTKTLEPLWSNMSKLPIFNGWVSAADNLFTFQSLLQ